MPISTLVPILNFQGLKMPSMLCPSLNLFVILQFAGEPHWRQLIITIIVKVVITSFAAVYKSAVKRAQTALPGDTIECDLAHQYTHYMFLAEKLQRSGAIMTWSVGLILDTQERFAAMSNRPTADIVSPKLKSFLDKTPRFLVPKELL